MSSGIASTATTVTFNSTDVEFSGLDQLEVHTGDDDDTIDLDLTVTVDKVVDAGAGDAAHILQGDTAGGLQFRAAGDQPDGLAQGFQAEIIQQQALGACREGLGNLGHVFDFNFHGHPRIPAARMVDGLLNGAGRGDVVFLDQNSVIKPGAVIVAAARTHGVLLCLPQSGDGLAGVQDLHRQVPLQNRLEEDSPSHDERFPPEARGKLHPLGGGQQAVLVGVHERIQLGDDGPAMGRPDRIPGQAARIGTHLVAEVVPRVKREELLPQAANPRRERRRGRANGGTGYH